MKKYKTIIILDNSKVERVDFMAKNTKQLKQQLTEYITEYNKKNKNKIVNVKSLEKEKKYIIIKILLIAILILATSLVTYKITIDNLEIQKIEKTATGELITINNNKYYIEF